MLREYIGRGVGEGGFDFAGVKEMSDVFLFPDDFHPGEGGGNPLTRSSMKASFFVPLHPDHARLAQLLQSHMVREIWPSCQL